jgi:hypothetical protein
MWLIGRGGFARCASRRQGNSLMLAIAFARRRRQWAIRTDPVVAHPADRETIQLRGVLLCQHVVDQFSQSLSLRCRQDVYERCDGGNPRRQQILPGRRTLGSEMKSDFPAVLSGPSLNKPIRNQPVHEPNRPRMREAEDPPALMEFLYLASPIWLSSRNSFSSRLCRSTSW